MYAKTSCNFIRSNLERFLIKYVSFFFQIFATNDSFVSSNSPISYLNGLNVVVLIAEK